MTADSARAGLDRSGPGTWSDEEFLLRFGDLIGDRIAETLDELLEERAARPRRRLSRMLGLGHRYR
jgi:hypothetical protein